MKLYKKSAFNKFNLYEGAKLALKSCFFSYALVFILVSIIIISTPPLVDPSTTFWSLIFINSFSMYFIPFGLAVSIGNISISLIPLGLTLLFIFISYILAKQCKNLNPYILFIAFITNCALSVLISIPGKTISQEAFFKIIFYPSLVFFVGQIFALLSQSYPGVDSIFASFRYSKTIQKIPNFIRLGIRMSFATFAFIYFFSAAVFIIWALISFQEIDAVYNMINPPAFPALAFLLAQLVFVPNLIFILPAWFTPHGVSFEYSVPFSLWESRQALTPAVPIFAAYPTNNSFHLIWFFVLGAFLSLGLIISIFIIKMTKRKAYRISFIREKENIVKIERFNFGHTLAQLHTSEFINRVIAAFICCGIANALFFIYIQIIFFFSSGVIGVKSLNYFGVDSFYQSLEICTSLVIIEIATLLIWSIFTIVRGHFAKKQIQK